MEDEYVIPDCLLASAAVRERLGDDLFTEDLSALLPPAPAVVQFVKITGCDEHSGGLADPVVVGRRAARILPSDLPHVQIDRVSQAIPELPRDQPRLGDEVDGPDPVDHSNRELERAAQVHP